MPLYEYVCSRCHERFELLRRMGESDRSVRCPECGAPRVKRQLSTFAAVAAVAGAGGSAAADSGGCSRPGCQSGFT